MGAYRQDRINEAVATELTAILRAVKDPRVSRAFISITGAQVSREHGAEKAMDIAKILKEYHDEHSDL